MLAPFLRPWFSCPSRKHHRGFLSMELFLVLVVVGAALSASTAMLLEYSATQKGRRAGEQIAAIGSAVDALISETYDILTNQVSVCDVRRRSATLAAFGPAPGDGRIGWYETLVRFPNITTEGQLVARAGYNASQWAAYLRLDGSRAMSGDLDMGGNNIKNVRSIQYDPNSQVNYSDVCAKTSDGSRMADGDTDAGLPGSVTDSNKRNRFGKGVQAMWRPPTQNTKVSDQLLTCTVTSDGVFRWMKPSGTPLSLDEMLSYGMMDGWVSGSQFMCDIGKHPGYSLRNSVVGSDPFDMRAWVRFKIKNSMPQLQVYTGNLIDAGSEREDPTLYRDLQTFVGRTHSNLVQSASIFVGTVDGGTTLATRKWTGTLLSMPFQLPGVGWICVNGQNKASIPVWADYVDLSVFTTGTMGYPDPYTFGYREGSVYGTGNSSAITFYSEFATTMPSVAKSGGVLNAVAYVEQATEPISAAVTGATCTSIPVCVTSCVPPDPVTGFGGYCSDSCSVPPLTCVSNGGSVDIPAARVSRGYTTVPSHYNLVFPWVRRENPSTP